MGRGEAGQYNSVGGRWVCHSRTMGYCCSFYQNLNDEYLGREGTLDFSGNKSIINILSNVGFKTF